MQVMFSYSYESYIIQALEHIQNTTW